MTTPPLGPAATTLILLLLRLHAIVQMQVWCCMTTYMLAGGRSMLICMDEVQIAYNKEMTGSSDFWNQLKRLEAGPGALAAAHDTRVVMAAAYGTNRSAAGINTPESPTATPVNFEHPDMVITIFPSPSGASLALSDAEWGELWRDYLRSTGLYLDDLIKDHVGLICSGQVGCIALPVLMLRLHRLHKLLIFLASNRQRCHNCSAGRAADSLSRLPQSRAGK